MKTSIIILHGWGLKGNIYQELKTLLEKEGFPVFAPDLPGFGAEPLHKQGRARLLDRRGKEPLKNSSMNLDNYVDFVRNFMRKNKIRKPILIGHSFGGRIAIKYAFNYPDEIKKLILTGVPITRDNSFSRKIAFTAAVIGGTILKVAPKKINNFARKILYFLIGEWDYYKAGPLKEVFKNIVGEDLKTYLGQIKIPIIFIWGRDDKITPLPKISHFDFIIIENAGHKLPHEKPEIFKETILKFLNDD